jgi:multicomponent K+:H+ antiporter subunit E
MVRLTALVVKDIALSNVAVAGIVLGPGRRHWVSGFVEIPLELRDPYGLAALACIVTSTPGTLWTDYDAATGILTIHVLDLVDSAAWIRTIKERYERPLLEIFA